jgi:hypothetical protein
MAAEDLEIKAVRQLVASSGLWLREVHNKTKEECFRPVVALALVDVTSPSPSHFLDQAIVPITTNDMMYGALERTPYLGLKVRYSIFHDADFEERGVRLKEGAKPRSVHSIPVDPYAHQSDVANDEAFGPR